MDACSRLDRTLEEFGENTVIPRGFRGAMFAAIDDLISAGAPKERIDAAGRICVAVQKLEWAMIKQDEERIAEVRQQLGELIDRWLSSSTALH